MEGLKDKLKDNFFSFGLYALVFIAPILFISPNILSLGSIKTVFVFSLIAILFIVHLVLIIKRGYFLIPNTKLFYFGAVVFGVYILSAVFSRGPAWVSVLGYGSEIFTLASLFFMFVLTLLVTLEFRSISRIILANSFFLFAAFLLAIFHLCRLFLGADFLSFGVFQKLTSTPIGIWPELAIFFGVSTIVSVSAVESLNLKPLFQWFLNAVFVLSLAMLVVVNFNIVWYAIGVASLFLSLYFSGAFYFDKGLFLRKVPWRAVSLFVISLVFIFPFTGQMVGERVSKFFDINFLNVRPSWSGTLDVAKASFYENPLLGSGPNRFSLDWELHRPDINFTDYWNAPFSSGVGFLPTTIIETGLAGLLSWLIFLGFVFWSISKNLFIKASRPESVFVVASSSVTTMFLWAVNIFFVPSLTILTLTFFFTGLSIASLLVFSDLKNRVINFRKNENYFTPFVIVGLIILIIATVNFDFLIFKRAYALSQFKKADAALSTARDIDTASKNILQAINISENDFYYRALADVKLVELKNFIDLAASGATITEETRSNFEQSLSVAVEASRRARDFDPENFTNWFLMARVYSLMASVDAPQSYQVASELFDEAIKRSPKNPLIYLERARLEILNKDNTKAREYVVKALELKPNFSEAVLLISKIDVTNGNAFLAVSALEKLVGLNPNDPTAFFYLGLLKYEEKDWNAAASSFEKAVEIVPDYADARYFLGMSYYNADRLVDAIEQFEYLVKTNPENQEVNAILENIKAGRSSLSEVRTSIEETQTTP